MAPSRLRDTVESFCRPHKVWRGAVHFESEFQRRAYEVNPKPEAMMLASDPKENIVLKIKQAYNNEFPNVHTLKTCTLKKVSFEIYFVDFGVF